jgi:hypothetical protein
MLTRAHGRRMFPWRLASASHSASDVHCTSSPFLTQISSRGKSEWLSHRAPRMLRAAARLSKVRCAHACVSHRTSRDPSQQRLPANSCAAQRKHPRLPAPLHVSGSRKVKPCEVIVSWGPDQIQHGLRRSPEREALTSCCLRYCCCGHLFWRRGGPC